jgi:hypothetical protein
MINLVNIILEERLPDKFLISGSSKFVIEELKESV